MNPAYDRSLDFLRSALFYLVLLFLPTTTQAQDEILEAHRKVRPALVRIEGTGETPDGKPISVFGTGVLLDRNGTILTALHVLAPLEASDPTKIDIRVRVKESAAIARAADSISDIESRDLAILRISDPPEDLDYACRTTSGNLPDDFPVVLTSGFEADGSYVRRQGPIIGSGPRGTIFVDMSADKAQSGSPVYEMSGEVVGTLKGVREGRPGESVFIPLSDVLGQLPLLPDNCLRQSPVINQDGEKEGHVDERLQRQVGSERFPDFPQSQENWEENVFVEPPVDTNEEDLVEIYGPQWRRFGDIEVVFTKNELHSLEEYPFEKGFIKLGDMSGAFLLSDMLAGEGSFWIQTNFEPPLGAPYGIELNELPGRLYRTSDRLTVNNPRNYELDKGQRFRIISLIQGSNEVWAEIVYIFNDGPTGSPR